MNDLEMVRTLAAEPTDESVSRTWHRLMRLQDTPVRRARLWVPAFAGLAVVAVLAVAVSFPSGTSGPAVGQWQTGEPPDAVTALNAMADLVAAQQETPVDRRYVRTRVSGWGGRCGVNGDGNRCEIGRQDREWGYDIDTGEVKLVRNFVDRLTRAGLAPGADPVMSAGIRKPTRAWLAGLPTDPVALLDRLRAEVGENTSWTRDHMVWDAMAGLYGYCDVALTPVQRAAFLRALARTPGLSTRGLLADGVSLIAIRHTDQDSGTEIIFDLGTGRAVGRGSAFLSKNVSVIQAKDGPTLPPGIFYQGIWKQEITNTP